MMHRSAAAPAICALILVPFAAIAAEESDVLFFAAFEGTTDATLSAGDARAQAVGQPVFGPGVRGQAVKLDAQTLLTYAFRGNVVPDEGTIMMWFKSEWRPDDDKFHNLFRASTGNFKGKALNTLMIYKYPRWARLSLYTSNGQRTSPQQGRSIAYRNNMSWEPGEWIHVAGTWCASVEQTEAYLCINGERVAACAGAVFLPETMPKVFEIGGPKGQGTTWFDDVLVLSRPLTQREIKEIHRASQTGSAAAPAELPLASSRELGLQPHVLFGSDQVVVLVDFRGARGELGEQGGTVELHASAGRMKMKQAAPATRRGTARFIFEGLAANAGQVDFAAAVRDHAGQVLRTGKLTYRVPAKPAWVGNSLGKTDQVLAPWEPLRATGDAVAMWGRRYDFSDAPLPKQLTTQGIPLLRAPARLTLGRGAGASRLSGRPAAGHTDSPAQVQREWAGTLGTLPWRATTRIEFDGFMLVDLEFSPRGPTDVDALELVLPLRSEAATLYHHCNGEWTDLSDAGAIGPPGWRKPLPFVPYVWVGTERGGVAWFCETNHTWRPQGAGNAVEIVHTGDGVDLVARFIATKTTLAKPMRLTFGFMATPVKPLPPAWRDWRPMFTSALHVESFAKNWLLPGCRNISILWNNHVGTFSYLPAQPQEMRAKVDLLKKHRWDTVVSYYAMNMTQTGSPEYALYEKEWRRNPYTESTLHQGNASSVCVRSTWADFLLWVMDKTMDDTGTDGVYIDCSNPRQCRSMEHGCAPGRYPLLAAREFYKRVYTLVQQKRGDKGFVYAHNSESHFMTAYSFTHAVLNGEQYNRKDLRTLTFEKFRGEFIPHPHGVPTFLLPTLVKFQPKKREKMPGAEFLAFPLLHDVVCIPPWMSRETQALLRKVLGIMHDFGVADGQFIPYWDSSADLAVAPADVPVSAYLRRDGRAALLIAQGKQPSQGLSVELRGRLASLTGSRAADPLTGTSLAWQDGKLVWPLPDRAVHVAIVDADQ